MMRGSPMKALPYILLAVIGTSSALCAQKPSPARAASKPDVPSFLRSAENALSRKDFPTAVAASKSALEVQPDSVPAWFDLAYAYSGLHQNEDAVKSYEKAIELGSDLFEARLNLGILLLELKKPELSLPHLRRAVALRPQHARAHLYYGRALALMGQADAARTQFQEALRLNPDLAIAHFDLGQLELAQKRYAEARAEFEKASVMDSKLAQAQLGLALVSEGLREEPEAISDLERYLAAEPGDFESRFHLARLYLHQEKHEQALVNLQIVYQANPKLPGVAAALGDVYALLKRFPESEKFYQEGLATAPAEADLHRAFGQTLLEEGKLSESENEFRAALRLDPRDREAAKGLATTLYLQKRYAEVIPIDEALARSPDPPAGLFFLLATCYDHLQNRPKALEDYEKFLRISEGRNPDQEWQARQRVKLLRRELGK